MPPLFFITHKLGDNGTDQSIYRSKKKTWGKKKKKRKPTQRSSISLVSFFRSIVPVKQVVGSRGEGEEYIFPPFLPALSAVLV